MPEDIISSLNGFNGGLFELKIPFCLSEEGLLGLVLVRPEDLEVGDPIGCVDIPFVTESSQWGKDQNEAAIHLRIPICRKVMLAIAQDDHGKPPSSSWGRKIQFDGSETMMRLFYESDEEVVDKMTDQMKEM